MGGTGYGPYCAWWQPGWGPLPSPYALFGSATPPVSPGLVWQNAQGVYSNTITPSGLTSIGVTTVNASAVNTSSIAATGGVTLSSLSAGGVLTVAPTTGIVGVVSTTGTGNAVLASSPTLVSPTINAITSDSSHNLLLSGGNTGASISIGYGSNANITITTSGTGSTSIVGTLSPSSVSSSGVIATTSALDYSISGPVASMITAGGIYAAKQIVSGTSMTVGTNLNVTGNIVVGSSSTIGNSSGTLQFTTLYGTLSGTDYININANGANIVHVFNAGVQLLSNAWLSVSSTIDAYGSSTGSIVSAGGINAAKQIIAGTSISTGQGAMASTSQWLIGPKRTSTGLSVSTTSGVQVVIDGTLLTLAVLTTNP